MASGLSPSTTNTTTNRLPFGMGGYASAPRGGLVSSRITMKICFFHLMPYRFLPEDFERKYRSVWVDVPHHLFDAEKTQGLYQEFLDELEFAEKQGFDGLCVNEHHYNAYGLMPSPNIMGATLTRRTSQAALVVLGNSLDAYHPPLRAAEEFAMLDLLSGGRLAAGFPVRAGFLQLVGGAESEAQAEREYVPHVHYFYQKCLNGWEGFAEAPGYRTVKTVQSGSRAQVGAAAPKARQSLDWGQYVDQGYIIAGSPKTVREQLTECIKSLRVGHLMVLLQIGSMPKELAFKNTELFAKDVMPHVRGLWPGYKDRWWPSGARNGS